MKTSPFYLPYNPKLIKRAKNLKKNMTKAEKRLWYDYLRTFPFRVHRQRPIHNFIVDFYCPILKLVIEVDGESHNTDTAKVYDQETRGGYPRVETETRYYSGVCYVRNVTQGEDASRIRMHKLPEIFAVARNFALNLYRCNDFKNMAQAQRLCTFGLDTLTRLFRMK